MRLPPPPFFFSTSFSLTNRDLMSRLAWKKEAVHGPFSFGKVSHTVDGRNRNLNNDVTTQAWRVVRSTGPGQQWIATAVVCLSLQQPTVKGLLGRRNACWNKCQGGCCSKTTSLTWGYYRDSRDTVELNLSYSKSVSVNTRVKLILRKTFWATGAFFCSG